MKTAALVTGVFLLGVPGCHTQTGMPDIAADLACETARMAVQLRQEMAPVPKSDKCERCDGTGKIGDRASISMTCPDCRGTGKRPKSVCVNCPEAKP